MEVFSDFQCPACKSLYDATNRNLMDNYVNTGKVYLIHRDFPLPMHSHSKVAAQYSRAAAQIGKLEAVEEVLFPEPGKVGSIGRCRWHGGEGFSPAEMAKVRALVKSGSSRCLDRKRSGDGQHNVSREPDADDDFSRQRADIPLCRCDELGHFETVPRSTARRQVRRDLC